MTLADAKFQVALQHRLHEAAREGRQGRRQGHRQGRRRRSTTRTRRASRRPPRATCASCSRRPRPRPTPPCKALAGGQSWNDVAKKYSIDQASKDAGRLAARHRQGHAGEGLRRRDLRRAEGQAHRPGQDPVRLLRLPGPEDHAAKQQTLKEATPGDQAAARRAEQAEGRRRVQHGAAQEVEGDARTARRLRHGPVQERAEAEDDAPRPARCSRRRSRSRSSRRRSRLTASPRLRRAPTPPVGFAAVCRPRRDQRGARAPRRADAAPAGRVPVGPRAGRALDRPAHRRGGLRARRRRATRRRRQAARRARRRALPGPLPVAAARGARRRRPRRGRRALPPEAHPPPPARLRRRRGRQSPGEVLRNWDQIKASEAGREPGIFGEVPENLPALLYARKVQRRAATRGPARARARRRPAARASATPPSTTVGERLFAAVDEARRLRVDPELALRAAAAALPRPPRHPPRRHP